MAAGLVKRASYCVNKWQTDGRFSSLNPLWIVHKWQWQKFNVWVIAKLNRGLSLTIYPAKIWTSTGARMTQATFYQKTAWLVRTLWLLLLGFEDRNRIVFSPAISAVHEQFFFFSWVNYNNPFRYHEYSKVSASYYASNVWCLLIIWIRKAGATKPLETLDCSIWLARLFQHTGQSALVTGEVRIRF